MEFEVLKSEKNLIELEIKGERHTLPNLLKAKLLENPEVSFTAYTMKHPLDNNSRFVLRTKTKAPAKVLSEACDALEKDLNDFEKALKKAFK